jgi:MFS family permease
MAGPTRARQIVVLFAVTLAIITYVDRICMSQAKLTIQGEFGLSDQQIGWVFSAFTLAYGLFEVPFGWLGDRHGPRIMLLRVVTMWSVFTAATGAAWDYVSLLVCRFMFGAGEAGCFPNISKMFTIWIPSRDRVRAQGLLWLSARWGGAFAPFLVVSIAAHTSWRVPFLVFGIAGVVWAVCFALWFRDDPREHRSVNEAELALLDGAECNRPSREGIPWRRFFRSPTVWLLWLQYFCMNYGWYFYITWLPTYLKEARGMSVGESPFFSALDPFLSLFGDAGVVQDLKLAVLAGIPLLFGGLGSLFCGGLATWFADTLGGTARSRKILGFTGLACAGALLAVSTRIESPLLAVMSMGAASFCNDLAMPGGWGAVMDVGGRYSGSLGGAHNMFGQAGGFLAPIAIPAILAATGRNWGATFVASATAYAVGAICWIFIDPVTPLDGSLRRPPLEGSRA